jgi:hypothetical protein
MSHLADAIPRAYLLPKALRETFCGVGDAANFAG